MGEPRVRFVVVVETDNLNVMDRDELARCLDSLAAQPRIREAEEVLLLDDGEAPADVVERIREEFPWISIVRPAASSAYFERKREGTARTSADVVVFADCDVEYASGWLDALLETMERDPSVRVVAGETTTRISGPHTLAFALSFNFPRPSGATEASAVPVYWANSVAFRRDVLDEVPIPAQPSVFRAQSHLHSLALAEHGIAIWRQPRALGLHAVVPLRSCLQRYFLLGRDTTRIAQLGRDASGQPFRAVMPPDTGAGVKRRLASRLRQIARGERALLRWLPLALPLLGLFGTAFLAGRLHGLLVPPGAAHGARLDAPA